MALPPWLPQTRLEAVEYYRKTLEKAATKSEVHLYEAKRRLARGDLYYLLVVLLHRRDFLFLPDDKDESIVTDVPRDENGRDWLFARCREVQESPNGHLDLWARGHYKSTIITFGLTIQEILNNPEITIGIFSDTNKVAKPFLKQIKTEFETNEELKRLFPDILWADPAKEAPKWSEDGGIRVKRKGNPKEETIEAYGLIDGQPTGRHFRLCLFDDVVTEETAGNDEARVKVTNRVRLADNLGSERGRKRFIGTRYHLFDTYADMIERKTVKVRLHPVTNNGKLDGQPVFLTPEAMAAKRASQGEHIFGCQMLLDPKADAAMGFKEEWLRYWDGTNTANLNIYILCDPASGKNAHKRKTDYTSFWVIGVGGDDNYYMLDAVRDRLNLTERTITLFDLHRKWRPLGVGYEEYGLQADIEHMQGVMVDQNYRFTITPLGGLDSKADRISQLVPVFEKGKFYLLTTCVRINKAKQSVDLTRIFIRDEYLPYPLVAHEDMLDALARIKDPKLFVLKPKEPDAPRSKWETETVESDLGWMAR